MTSSINLDYVCTILALPSWLLESEICNSAQIFKARQSMHPCCAFATCEAGNIQAEGQS